MAAPRITDPGRINKLTYSAPDRAKRIAECGLSWTPVGACATAVKVLAERSVMVYNDNAAVQFVAFGAAAMSAPSTAANGIPIPPKTVFILSSGDYEYIRSSSADVYAYTAPYYDPT